MIKVEGHRGANSRGYIYKHRYVMEQHLCRELEEWEIVHHVDGNKRNNDIANLSLATQSDHVSIHYKQDIEKYGKFGSAKLHKDDVKNIYIRIIGGEDVKKIASDYGITPENVDHIKNKKTWKTITDTIEL